MVRPVVTALRWVAALGLSRARVVLPPSAEKPLGAHSSPGPVSFPRCHVAWTLGAVTLSWLALAWLVHGGGL